MFKLLGQIFVFFVVVTFYFAKAWSAELAWAFGVGGFVVTAFMLLLGAGAAWLSQPKELRQKFF